MNKRKLWNIDLGLLAPVGILLIISFATLASISMDFVKSQLMFLVVSVIAFFITSQINYKVLKLYRLPIYILSIVLLVAVLALGAETRGSVRWVEFYGIRIQFSEFLKPFLAAAFSSYLVISAKYNLKSILRIAAFGLPIVLLILIQPDLGNALIYLIVALLVLFFFGFPIKYFIYGFLLLAGISPVLWQFLHEYQKQRILTFINPAIDPLGVSYNAIQAIITVGSGMIIGKGLGQGTQSKLSFLPEKHTDFIFAAISEQLGFIGGIIVIASFAFILYKIFQISQNSTDSFCKVFSASIFFIILVQFFVNIGMNIGILPIVGVTLPFVSYGGSSLLSNFILLGMLNSISQSTKEDPVLEIR